MGRTRLSNKRSVELREPNIGNILLFCEGNTEAYYFDYYKKIINQKNKFNNIEIEIESANGNAKRVLNYADSFFENQENIKKYINHEKYLIFDCDAPEYKIQDVILEACESYKLIISNCLFEIWFLMHFEEVVKALSKKKIYKKLSDRIDINYEKANEGIISLIIKNGDVKKAINNAKEINRKYNEYNFNITLDIKKMNPYTNIYELIEIFLSQI